MKKVRGMPRVRPIRFSKTFHDGLAQSRRDRADLRTGREPSIDQIAKDCGLGGASLRLMLQGKRPVNPNHPGIQKLTRYAAVDPNAAFDIDFGAGSEHREMQR